MKRFILVLCGLALFSIANAINCSATHFDFASRYTLGKQDELNRTFDRIQQKIVSLADVTYKPSEAVSFTISKVNPTFYYRDSKQKAVIKGNDTIVIDGGYLEVDFTFDWSKTTLVRRNGTGSAFGLSYEIIIAKKLVIDNGFYSYQLLDSMPVTFGSSFKINRLDPADLSEEDVANLNKMINFVEGNKDVRTQLQNQIDKYYNFYLGASLHDQHQAIDRQFDYKWIPNSPGKENITISMIRRPITVDVEKQGIQTTFDVQVENDTNWKCGDRNIPISPFDPRTYGGSQQFVSYDFYQSLLRYAIQKNILNTELSRENWQSRMFQFYAGDLYEVISVVQDKYFAGTEVTGSCKPTYDKLRVENGGVNSFRVFLHHDCSLLILKQKIIDFGLDLNLTVGGYPSQTSIDFKLKSLDQTIAFYPYGQYKLINEQLAIAMIKSSLSRLYDVRLFGSGWPLSPPRDYPEFITQTNFTVVYDSTHVFF